MQYWWVNHNQTARQEVEGQYLWSPKVQQGGAKLAFYDNMRRASPGDLVLSYSGQAVRFVGRVTEFAFTAPKPEEFGSTGAYWDNEGWLLPVFWVPLNPPISPKTIIEELGPLLPPRLSPIDPTTGWGRQKAYLAKIPEAAFFVTIAASAFDRSMLEMGGGNSLTFEVVNERLDDIAEARLLADASLDDTVKRTVVLARRGQGQFRDNVRSIERACRLTGVTNPALLIASHIKPWRACKTAEERIDGANGLLLTPDADHLFDRGYITFEQSGEVRISERIDRTDLRRLGLEHLTYEALGFQDAGSFWTSGPFESNRTSYLEYHRNEVFLT